MVRRTGARPGSVPSGIAQAHPLNGQGIAMMGGWAVNRIHSSFHSRIVAGWLGWLSETNKGTCPCIEE